MTDSDEAARMFARGVRRERERLGLSQSALAEEMRVLGFDWHQTSVYKVETEKRQVSVSEAVALTRIFDVDLTLMLDDSQTSRGALERQLTAAAERFVASVEDLDEVALRTEQARAALRTAVAAFDAAGYLTALDGWSTEDFAHEVYGSLIDATVAQNLREQLRTVFWSESVNPEFSAIADHFATRGLTSDPDESETVA